MDFSEKEDVLFLGKQQSFLKNIVSRLFDQGTSNQRDGVC